MESIRINQITRIAVKEKEVGNFKDLSVVFFVLGILSFWFFIGFIFLAWGVVAMFKKINTYTLVVVVKGQEVVLLTHSGKTHVKDIARTIWGLITSAKALHGVS